MSEIVIFCPDCRGKFEIQMEELIEEEILECDLCGAEIKVVSNEEPIKLTVFRLIQSI